MARLFISLYLLIAIGIVGLSALLEQIFFDDDIYNSAPSAQLINLIETINQSEQEPQKWLMSSGFKVTPLNSNDISWLAEEQHALDAGKAVSLYDRKLGHQLYIISRNNQLYEINLASGSDAPASFLLYSSAFFILLAGLLGIWVWPLWRDLAQVKKATEQLHPDGSIDPVKLGSNSLITPIADALNRMSQQVRQLLASQSELTGAVAHEFRTPLSRLKFALAMQSAPDSESIQAMNNDIDELEKLVQEMLSYTSMEVHIPEMNMSDIPLGHLCQSLVDKLDLSTRKQINIKVSGGAESVLADAHYIERAIDNLLLNACRYAQHSIRVYHYCEQNSVYICVDDDGSGVDPSLREKIFEPFFRPDDSRNRKRGGAGLGLAIVKRIMQWHKGDCWVEDSKIGGARFVLKFESVTSTP